jgi:hypothetical protein
VDDHVAATFETRNDGGIKRLKLGQLGARQSEDYGSESLVDESLAMSTDDFAEEEHAYGRIKLKDFGHGVVPV